MRLRTRYGPCPQAEKLVAETDLESTILSSLSFFNITDTKNSICFEFTNQSELLDFLKLINYLSTIDLSVKTKKSIKNVKQSLPYQGNGL